MQLKNKQNGHKYQVRTETDGYGGFMIYASAMDGIDKSFCMHYRSLSEFTEEWEDVEDHGIDI